MTSLVLIRLKLPHSSLYFEHYNYSVTGSSTLPRATSRVSDAADGRATAASDKVTAATSSTSLYDNVSGRDSNKSLAAGNRQTRDRETSTPGGKLNSTHATTQVPAQSQTEDVSRYNPFLNCKHFFLTGSTSFLSNKYKFYLWSIFI